MNSRSKRDRRESCIPMLSMGFLYSSYYKDSNKNGFRIKGAGSKMAAKESWFSLNTKQQSIWNRKPAQNWHLRLLPSFVSHFYWLSIIKADTSTDNYCQSQCNVKSTKTYNEWVWQASCPFHSINYGLVEQHCKPVNRIPGGAGSKRKWLWGEKR